MHKINTLWYPIQGSSAAVVIGITIVITVTVSVIVLYLQYKSLHKHLAVQGIIILAMQIILQSMMNHIHGLHLNENQKWMSVLLMES